MESPANSPSLSKAYFAGGCFWCIEADFQKVAGVREVISGYAGGTTMQPTYEQVVSGSTGHREAIDILVGCDRRDHPGLVHVARKRKLDEDAVHRAVGIEARDQRDQLGLGCAGGQSVLEARHSGRERGLALGADIDLARRILTDQHYRQSGLSARRGRESARRLGDPGAQGFGERLAVDPRRRHRPRLIGESTALLPAAGNPSG